MACSSRTSSSSATTTRVRQDPVCDTVIAWTFLSGEGRRVFQSRLPVDRGTWARGRGWALWKAMIVLVDALRDDPADALATKHVIVEVLAGDGLA